jgi:steroid delta-isomerase-like uncharacterized protein
MTKVKKTTILLVTFFALFVLGCGKKEAPSLADNKAVIRRSHEEVWSKGNLAVVDELYAPNFVCHLVVGPEWRGPEGVKQGVARHRRSFPDWNEHVEDIIAEGDKVVTRFTSSGTHKGELAGIAPTGKQVKISEIAIYRIADGKIVEQWGIPDLQGMQRQLGVVFPVEPDKD